jgi:tripartite-type tricarboxylate transporter receptor subunit TctC
VERGTNLFGHNDARQWGERRMVYRRVCAAVLLGLSALAAPAAAEDWPVRPITLVVPFAAGGGTDVLGRIIGKRLSEVLKQQVIIENVGGAGGMVGVARVAKADPDGYQIVLGSRADAINQTLYKRPLYNLRTDLVPVVLIADQPTVLITRNEFPANNLPDFINYVKANPGKVQFASAGAGSTGHLDCILFNTAMGVNVTHIPYRGGGPAMQDLIGGRVDYICTLSATALPPIESKLVKPIAVFTPKRAAMLPNLPTAVEQGFDKIEASTWFAFFAPKGTPAAIIKRLHDATVEAMETPAVQQQMLTAGAVVVAPERRSTEFLKNYVDSEIEKNAGPIKATGVSIE